MSFLKLPHVYLNLPNPTLRLCMISPPTLRSQFSIFFLLYRLLATVDSPSLPPEKSYDPPQNCFHPSPPLLSSPPLSSPLPRRWKMTGPLQYLDWHAVLLFFVRDKINLRVDVEHSDDTTDLVENGKLQLPLPPFLTYNDFTKFSNSISVVAQSDSQMVSFKVRNSFLSIKTF